MHTAVLAALMLSAIANGLFAYINMMLVDNELAIGLSAATSIVSCFAAVYVWSV